MNTKVSPFQNRLISFHPMKEEIRTFVDQRQNVKAEGSIKLDTNGIFNVPFLEAEFLTYNGNQTLKLEPPLQVAIDRLDLTNLSIENLLGIFEAVGKTFNAAAEVKYQESCDDSQLVTVTGSLKFDIGELKNEIKKIVNSLSSKASSK